MWHFLTAAADQMSPNDPEGENQINYIISTYAEGPEDCRRKLKKIFEKAHAGLSDMELVLLEQLAPSPDNCRYVFDLMGDDRSKVPQFLQFYKKSGKG